MADDVTSAGPPDRQAMPDGTGTAQTSLPPQQKKVVAPSDPREVASVRHRINSAKVNATLSVSTELINLHQSLVGKGSLPTTDTLFSTITQRVQANLAFVHSIQDKMCESAARHSYDRHIPSTDLAFRKQNSPPNPSVEQLQLTSEHEALPKLKSLLENLSGICNVGKAFEEEVAKAALRKSQTPPLKLNLPPPPSRTSSLVLENPPEQNIKRIREESVLDGISNQLGEDKMQTTLRKKRKSDDVEIDVGGTPIMNSSTSVQHLAEGSAPAAVQDSAMATSMAMPQANKMPLPLTAPSPQPVDDLIRPPTRSSSIAPNYQQATHDTSMPPPSHSTPRLSGNAQIPQAAMNYRQGTPLQPNVNSIPTTNANQMQASGMPMQAPNTQSTLMPLVMALQATQQHIAQITNVMSQSQFKQAPIQFQQNYMQQLQLNQQKAAAIQDQLKQLQMQGALNRNPGNPMMQQPQMNHPANALNMQQNGAPVGFPPQNFPAPPLMNNQYGQQMNPSIPPQAYSPPQMAANSPSPAPSLHTHSRQGSLSLAMDHNSPRPGPSSHQMQMQRPVNQALPQQSNQMMSHPYFQQRNDLAMNVNQQQAMPQQRINPAANQIQRPPSVQSNRSAQFAPASSMPPSQPINAASPTVFMNGYNAMSPAKYPESTPTPQPNVSMPDDIDWNEFLN